MAGHDPLVLDSRALGTLWLGSVRVDADSSGSRFTTNTTCLRAETSRLMHIRQPYAVRVIGGLS
jgi:hypothetical protein